MVENKVSIYVDDRVDVYSLDNDKSIEKYVAEILGARDQLMKWVVNGEKSVVDAAIKKFKESLSTYPFSAKHYYAEDSDVQNVLTVLRKAMLHFIEFKGETAAVLAEQYDGNWYLMPDYMMSSFIESQDILKKLCPIKHRFFG